MSNAHASAALGRIIDHLDQQTGLQPLSFGRAVSKIGVTRGAEYVTVRCCEPDDPSLWQAPKILFAVLGDEHDLSGYVMDIQASPNYRGVGAQLWCAVRDAAWTSGLSSVRLRTHGAGGGFWVKQGFELADALNDAPGVLRKHRSRAAHLAEAGFPVNDDYLTWCESDEAVSWLGANGIQALWAHLPTKLGPALAEDGTPSMSQARVPSTVLFGVEWDGVLHAPPLTP